MNLAMILGLFPGFMSMIAIYFILKALGLTQTLLALILCYSAGAGLGFYVAKGFFDTVPNALVESAKLDGATQAQIFWHIILPLSKPIIIYTALLAFTGPWMDFIFARVILGEANTDLHTVAVGLYQMMYGAHADNNIFHDVCGRLRMYCSTHRHVVPLHAEVLHRRRNCRRCKRLISVQKKADFPPFFTVERCVIARTCQFFESCKSKLTQCLLLQMFLQLFVFAEGNVVSERTTGVHEQCFVSVFLT